MPYPLIVAPRRLAETTARTPISKYAGPWNGQNIHTNIIISQQHLLQILTAREYLIAPVGHYEHCMATTTRRLVPKSTCVSIREIFRPAVLKVPSFSILVMCPRGGPPRSVGRACTLRRPCANAIAGATGRVVFGRVNGVVRCAACERPAMIYTEYSRPGQRSSGAASRQTLPLAVLACGAQGAEKSGACFALGMGRC